MPLPTPSRRSLRIALAAAFTVGAAAPAGAGSFFGRAITELEYLGQNYRSVVDLPPIPDFDDDTVRLTDTTRFTEDTWLPGQRIELGWDVDAGTAAPLELRSATRINAERFVGETDLRLDDRDLDGRGWLVTAEGSLRDEARSFVGHGDWTAGADLRRAWRNGNTLLGAEIGWDHSSTRGDTVSFIQDYDRARLRLDVEGGRGWLPSWEGYVEGVLKSVPAGVEGAYAEARAGGRWRPGGDFRNGLDLDLTWRDYRTDGEIGRDFLEARLEGRFALARPRAATVFLESEATLADYRGEDEIYYDFAELTLFFPVEVTPGEWTVSVGPRARLQRDLLGGDRDYGQWTGRAEAGRAFGAGGLAQFGLEAGYRDYAGGGGDALELSALSTTLFRTDYTLVEAFALVDVPMGAGFSLELLADSALENHAKEEERIHVTFITLGVARAFP